MLKHYLSTKIVGSPGGTYTACLAFKGQMLEDGCAVFDATELRVIAEALKTTADELDRINPKAEPGA